MKKIMCPSLIFNKVAGSRHGNLLRETLRRGRLLMGLTKFLRIPILNDLHKPILTK